jgi:glycosyltransferase involved in cell wall biosynthesis
MYLSSYLVTTYNKFPWVRESVPRLIRAKPQGAEIVIVDGGSNDGTAEYLRRLNTEGEIDQLLSEPDAGEAHGLNKGLLLCRGDLIKLVTDDDVFDYTAIERCEQFMRTHEEVDLLVTPAVNASVAEDCIVHYSLVCPLRDEQAFVDRREMNTCGLGILLRKRSIPLLGLFSTSFVWVDYEFLTRAIHTRATIAWFSDPVALRIHNPSSNSVRFAHRLAVERMRLNRYYASTLRPNLVDRLRGLKHRLCTKVHEFHQHVRLWAPERGSTAPGAAGSNTIGLESLSSAALFAAGERILKEFRNPDGGHFVVSRPPKR